jgi:cell division protein FtsB
MALSRRLPRYALRASLLGVGLYYAVWGGEYSALDLLRLQEMRTQEEAELAASREAVDSLRVQAERLEKDPATLERVARERFGMIRDGELLYRFVQVDPVVAQESRVAVSP